MCRFVAYTGEPIAVADLVTRPVHSIIHQSFKAREREEPLNGDGFGVGWYVPSMSEAPAIFRDVSPAWNNLNLLELARVTRSGTIFAHVRAATQGLGVMQANCHPFAHGRHMFMHNGNIEGFRARRRQMMGELSDEGYASVRGTTDSEYVFALWRDELDRTDAQPPELERMATAMVSTLGRLRELMPEGDRPSTMNFVVTDGERVVASRAVVGDPVAANTLYTFGGARFTVEDGVCRMDDLSPDGGESIMVASEPLFEAAAWQPVRVNRLVLIEDGRIETRDLGW